MAETENGRVRVALVDDHPIVRQGLRGVIEQEADLCICGEADTASEALRMIEESKPHVAIVDLSLREGNGLDLIKDIQARKLGVLVLVLTMRGEGLYAERVLKAGARGFLTKDEGPKRVIEAIRKVLQGQIFLDEQTAAQLVERVVSGGGSASPVERLTDRELQVFEMVGRGMPTREVAEKLHVSVKTVESHRENIKRKLGIDSAPSLLRAAIEWVRGLGHGS